MPRLLFISQATEYGTLYTLDELKELRAVCDKRGLYLYIDGARLGCAMAAEPGVGLAELAAVADAFYIGGTKNGLFMGEAMVILNDALKPGFRNVMKQRGAMSAKGFLIGAQFAAAFKDGLYFRLAEHAVAMSSRLTAGLSALGVSFEVAGSTNQIFPIIPTAVKERLEKDLLFIHWGSYAEGLETIRLVTTWQTSAETVDEVVGLFEVALKG